MSTGTQERGEGRVRRLVGEDCHGQKWPRRGLEDERSYFNGSNSNTREDEQNIHTGGPAKHLGLRENCTHRKIQGQP